MVRAAIIFQAYGKKEILEECLWALLSLNKHVLKEEMPEICIYTDQKEWFEQQGCPLALSYREITAEEIRNWRGKVDFVHRLKIEVLKDALTRYEAVLYLDTDIIFRQSPLPILERVAAGDHFMHVREGRISGERNITFAKLNRFLKKSNPFHFAFGTINIAAETEMWNAGVLGLSQKDLSLLDQALALTDEIFPRFPKHIVEQMAFSVLMQQSGAVYGSGATILHYWNLKEIRSWTSSFLEHFKDKSWMEKVQLTSLIPAHLLLLEKLNFYLRRSMWQKMKKTEWKPEPPDWNSLAQQLN